MVGDRNAIELKLMATSEERTRLFLEIVLGAGTLDPVARTAFSSNACLDAIHAAQAGRVADMDAVARSLAEG